MMMMMMCPFYFCRRGALPRAQVRPACSPVGHLGLRGGFGRATMLLRALVRGRRRHTASAWFCCLCCFLSAGHGGAPHLGVCAKTSPGTPEPCAPGFSLEIIRMGRGVLGRFEEVGAMPKGEWWTFPRHHAAGGSHAQARASPQNGCARVVGRGEAWPGWPPAAPVGPPPAFSADALCHLVPSPQCVPGPVGVGECLERGQRPAGAVVACS